jgi:hypothetical protein
LTDFLAGYPHWPGGSWTRSSDDDGGITFVNLGFMVTVAPTPDGGWTAVAHREPYPVARRLWWIWPTIGTPLAIVAGITVGFGNMRSVRDILLAAISAVGARAVFRLGQQARVGRWTGPALRRKRSER